MWNSGEGEPLPDFLEALYEGEEISSDEEDSFSPLAPAFSPITSPTRRGSEDEEDLLPTRRSSSDSVRFRSPLRLTETYELGGVRGLIVGRGVRGGRARKGRGRPRQLRGRRRLPRQARCSWQPGQPPTENWLTDDDVPEELKRS